MSGFLLWVSSFPVPRRFDGCPAFQVSSFSGFRLMGVQLFRFFRFSLRGPFDGCPGFHWRTACPVLRSSGHQVPSAGNIH